VSFDVTADAYGRFMGRHSEPLADEFVEWAGVREGQRALDVGCGPGALTARLVARLGLDHVSGADPSASFVSASRERFPGLDVREAAAEHLPYDDDAFDVALAQLVVHFMADPVAGVREMARVTQPGGTVAAAVWDLTGDSPLTPFWSGVRDVVPDVHDESDRYGGREGQLEEVFGQAGLADVEGGTLTVDVDFATFEEWWEPFTFGVGPAGSYAATLDDDQRAAVRAACANRLGEPPFTVHSSCWVVRGRA